MKDSATVLALCIFEAACKAAGLHTLSGLEEPGVMELMAACHTVAEAKVKKAKEAADQCLTASR